MKAVFAQLGFVARQQRVSRQHQVEVADLVEAPQALRAMQQQHAQAGREAGRLGLPIAHQAGGRHHQGWIRQAPGFLFDQDVGQGLHRLAQAHVIGQDAGKVIFAQELHPGQALALVVAQARLQAGRGGDAPHAVEVAQLLPQFARTLAAHPAQVSARLQLGKAGRVQLRQADAVADALVEIQLAQGRQDGLDAAPRQGHAHAIGQSGDQLLVVGPFGQGGRVEGLRRAPYQLQQHGQQRHAGAVDDDAQLQIEPGAARFAALVDFGVPVIHRADVEAVVGAVFDQPAARAQPGHALRGECQPSLLRGQFHGAGHRPQGRTVPICRREAERAQGGAGLRFHAGVTFDQFPVGAALALHLLLRVGRGALAVVVEGQQGEVVPAVQIAQQEEGARHDIGAHALPRKRRRRHDASQALRQHFPPQRRAILAGHARRLRHQFLQFLDRDGGDAGRKTQFAHFPALDVQRRHGRQDGVDGAAVGKLPVQAQGGVRLVGLIRRRPPGQDGGAGRPRLERQQASGLQVGARRGPQQASLIEQLAQELGADCAARLRRGDAEVDTAAQGRKQIVRVVVGLAQIVDRARAQRVGFGQHAGGNHAAVAAQARFAQV